MNYHVLRSIGCEPETADAAACALALVPVTYRFAIFDWLTGLDPRTVWESRGMTEEWWRKGVRLFRVAYEKTQK